MLFNLYNRTIIKIPKLYNMQKVLNIFDFDGTLFRSPEANSKLWQATLLGKIRSPPAQQGLGWYQELVTLQAPYVAENPDESWFNPAVLKKCRESIADPNCVTVLLTGRLHIYEERIRHIVKCIGLEFDHYGLKPGHYMFTMDFKIGFIHDLVEKYKDQLYKITLYDDRVEHSSRFSNLLKGTNLEIEVIEVPQDVTYLDRELEIEVVKKLLEKNAPDLQLDETPAYTGVMLDEESHKALLSWIPIPEQWKVQAHHMTISIGTQDIPEGSPIQIGDEVELEVTAIGFDTRSLAVQVTGAASINAIPHVTIAHAPDAKPADSNLIKTWIPLEDLKKEGFNGVLSQERAVKQVAVEPVYVRGRRVNPDAATTVDSSSSSTITTTTTTTDTSTTISVTTVSSVETITTTHPPKIESEDLTPKLSIQTYFPEKPKLRGKVHVRTIFGTAKPPPILKERSNFPKGFNIGEAVAKYHPEVKGKQIGEVVKQTREWAAGKDQVTIDEIDDFIKNLKLE